MRRWYLIREFLKYEPSPVVHGRFWLRTTAEYEAQRLNRIHGTYEFRVIHHDEVWWITGVKP
jgi:hypothetical protein